MKINIRTVLACACAAITINGYSQKEQYFRPSANGGISTIHYSAGDISSKFFAPSSIGGGVAAEYMVFCNQYVGASAGLGVSMYRSSYELNTTLNAYLPFFYVEEQDTREFTYSAKFENWEERQRLFTFDIPIGAVGRYSFSDKITAMAGLGVKLQFPVKGIYKVDEDGTRTSTGYFKEANVVFDETLAHYGFYKLNGGQKADLNTKSIAFAAYLDLGVTHKIGKQRVYYGIYGQFGFTQVNAEPETEFLTQYGPYDSPLNTTAIDKSRLLSLGVKLGYVLPVKGVEEDVQTAEEETVPEETMTVSEEVKTTDENMSNLKPERDEFPYTTADVDPNQTLSSSAMDNEPQKENMFKRFFGKFKK